jgi:hypothetical protein
MHIFILLWLVSFQAIAQEESNTGEINGDLSTNQQNSVVDSHNQTQNTSTVYNGAGSSSTIPVASAIAPSGLMAGGNESCLKSESGGLSSLHFGISSGRYTLDEECERRRDSTVLFSLGLKISAIVRMCQSPQVFEALFFSGTPCPVVVGTRTVAGKNAYLVMKKNPSLFIPNYNEEGKTELYNVALGINGSDDDTNDEKETEITSKSISDRFRTTKW